MHLTGNNIKKTKLLQECTVWGIKGFTTKPGYYLMAERARNMRMCSQGLKGRKSIVGSRVSGLRLKGRKSYGISRASGQLQMTQ